MIPKYPGDATLRKYMKTYGCPISLEELKAAMAGAIFGVEFVPPSEVLTLLEDEAEDSDFGSEIVPEEFFGTVMGLWNEIADFQNSKNVFAFAPFPPGFDENNTEHLVLAGEQRLSELEYFFAFLTEAEGPESDLPSSLPNVLEASAQILSNQLDELENGNTRDAAQIAKTIRNMDRDVKMLFPLFMENIKEARAEILDDDSASAASQPAPAKAQPGPGRNSPCPCGSGKKYKHCCLQ